MPWALCSINFDTNIILLSLMGELNKRGLGSYVGVKLLSRVNTS